MTITIQNLSWINNNNTSLGAFPWFVLFPFDHTLQNGCRLHLTHYPLNTLYHYLVIRENFNRAAKDVWDEIKKEVDDYIKTCEAQRLMIKV